MAIPSAPHASANQGSPQRNPQRRLARPFPTATTIVPNHPKKVASALPRPRHPAPSASHHRCGASGRAPAAVGRMGGGGGGGVMVGTGVRGQAASRATGVGAACGAATARSGGAGRGGRASTAATLAGAKAGAAAPFSAATPAGVGMAVGCSGEGSRFAKAALGCSATGSAFAAATGVGGAGTPRAVGTPSPGGSARTGAVA